MSKNFITIMSLIIVFFGLIFIFPDFFSRHPNIFLPLLLILILGTHLIKKFFMQGEKFIGIDFHSYSRPVTEPSEKKLRKLLWMSKNQLRKELIPDKRNIQADIEHAIELSEKVQSYCSLNVLIDSSIKELQDRDFVTIYRRIDFVAPDTFHVSQDAWDSKLGRFGDEWISIGDKNFQNTGLWSSTVDRYNAELNEKLKMDGYLEIMCNNKPINQEVLFFDENRYLIMEYKVPLSGKFIIPLIKSPALFTCQIYLWIDLDSGFFVKGEIIFKEKSNIISKIINVCISHRDIIAKHIDVYTCHNENIKIETPMLNTTAQNEKGEFTIKNTDIFTVPHHS